MKTNNMKRQGAAALAVAAALAAGFTPAGAEGVQYGKCTPVRGPNGWGYDELGHECHIHEDQQTLDGLKKISNDKMPEVPTVGDLKTEIVPEFARPAKTKLTAEELRRLIAVAEMVPWVVLPQYEGVSIGVFNVHHLLLKITSKTTETDGIEGIILRRRFFLNGGRDTEYAVLPDGRVGKTTRGRSLTGLVDVPLEELDVLHGELEFWIHGDGWEALRSRMPVRRP